MAEELILLGNRDGKHPPVPSDWTVWTAFHRRMGFAQHRCRLLRQNHRHLMYCRRREMWVVGPSGPPGEGQVCQI